MKRFAPVIALVIAAVVLGAVNATIFAYRWMQATVNVAKSTDARGAACVGFYSSAEQGAIPLPSAGTNNNAPTYGSSNEITVKPGQIVCQWESYKLYEGITVNVPITVGSWYIRDFYGFGYYGTAASDPTVYVYIKVKTPISSDSNIAEAKLILYKVTTTDETGEKAAEVDLLTSETVSQPIELNPGNALQLDLFINAIAATTTVKFEVGFYVSQEREAPR